MHWQREREVGTANAKCEIHSSAKGIGVGSFQEGPGRGGENQAAMSYILLRLLSNTKMPWIKHTNAQTHCIYIYVHVCMCIWVAATPRCQPPSNDNQRRIVIYKCRDFVPCRRSSTGSTRKAHLIKMVCLRLESSTNLKGVGVREGQGKGRRRRCRRGGAGPEIGVRTNRLNFAESKGKYTTRIVTEVTRVTSPPLPLSFLPSPALAPNSSSRNDCSDKRKRFVGIRPRQTELWEIVVASLLWLKL